MYCILYYKPMGDPQYRTSALNRGGLIMRGWLTGIYEYKQKRGVGLQHTVGLRVVYGYMYDTINFTLYHLGSIIHNDV